MDIHFELSAQNIMMLVVMGLSIWAFMSSVLVRVDTMDRAESWIETRKYAAVGVVFGLIAVFATPLQNVI